MPPNSSGHILLQELNIVEQFDQNRWLHTAESVHLMVEAKNSRLRSGEIYGRPGLGRCPIKGMLSKDYAKKQAERIDLSRAATDVPSGGPNSLRTPPASAPRSEREMLSACCRVYNRDLVQVSSLETPVSCSTTG